MRVGMEVNELSRNWRRGTHLRQISRSKAGVCLAIAQPSKPLHNREVALKIALGNTGKKSAE